MGKWDNGIFYRPIARVTPEGEIDQYAFGPWEARQCHGALQVFVGAVQTITITVTEP